jgi:hypothetical protein
MAEQNDRNKENNQLTCKKEIKCVKQLVSLTK